MKRIEWTSAFEVGIDEIDTQHRMFIQIISKLIDAHNKSTDKRLLECLLSELLKFADFHFCSEENVMRAFDYPSLIEHRKEHEKVLSLLRNRFFALQYEYIDFENLESFLADWFTQHMVKDDAKLARFIRQQK